MSGGKLERPDWRGRTVACIASGPSLTVEDCKSVRAAGVPTVVTNTTFRLCPWANFLFAHDKDWWQTYRDEVAKTFPGRLVSAWPAAPKVGVETIHGLRWFHHFHNSGACAISLAIAGRATRVVLLGYDASRGAAGESHHHGDHPQGMSNCLSMKLWPHQFESVARIARAEGVQVMNASRRTALKCFERVELSEALR